MSFAVRPRNNVLITLFVFSVLFVLQSLWATDSGNTQKVWTTSSFLDFVDGTLADGGANTYVVADGTVRLINVWDLDNDGHLDLVFPSSHDSNEKVDLFIYWGESEFDPSKRVQLPSDGGKMVEVVDLNQDQYLDLILVNRFNGTRTELNSYIYWGSQSGFDSGRRTLLPTRGAEAVTTVDLNGDGWLDIVFANNGLSYHMAVDRFNQSFIYWGSKAGYSVESRTSLRTALARDVESGDLDRDGSLDLIFAIEGNRNEDSGAWVYWGDGAGDFSKRPFTRLPGERSAAVAVEDLNEDGWPEVVLANGFRLRSQEMGIYNIVDTVAINSFVYWGGKDGYSVEERTDLPTVRAKAVDVADLNGDQRPDIIFANGSGGASFIYWATADGFHPNKRTALPTSGAADTRVEDINEDGHPDLVIAQQGKGVAEENRSLIYWGSTQGPSQLHMTALPTLRATGVAIGDLDSNGKKDLVFANKSDGNSSVPSLIYWGNPQGRYKQDERLALPTSGCDSYAAADVNQDGFPDLFFPGVKSSIYWGGSQVYSEDRKMELNSELSTSGRFADFNRDGFLDLALSEWEPGHQETSLHWGGPGDYSSANRFVFHVGGLRNHGLADLDRNGWLDLIFTSTTNRELIIYWNQEQGFDNAKKTALPTGVSVALEVADLDGDGYLEIIVANLIDPNPNPDQPQSFGGSPQGNTFIYWGSAQGYAAARRQVLPSIGNADVAVADLNQDGRLDLVLSSYHAGSTRSHPSTLYWNSAQGFDAARITRLPTNSASGVLVADFDRNGHEDILFACHSKDGHHRNDAFLYWGSPAGYSPDRISRVPVLGPHFLSVIDIGQIYDRNDRYDFISPPFDGGPKARFSSLAWEGDTPFRTAIELQVRTATTRSELETTPWRGPQGLKSFYTESPVRLEILPESARWVQYKASLLSPDSANSPVLRSVSIGLDQ